MKSKLIHLRDGNVVLYRREHSSKYQARLRLVSGKWKRISTGESDVDLASKSACEQYDELKFKLKNNIQVNPKRFKDVARIAINEMNKELEAGYGKKSFVDYIAALNNYFIPYFGNTYVDNIDYKKLKEYEEWKAIKTRRQLKHSTLNNHNAAIKRVFNVALERGWIQPFQVPHLPNKGQQSKRRPAFTVEEYRKLYRFMRHWHSKARLKKSRSIRELLRDYVLVIVNTGMRPGTESNNLKWKDIEEIEQDGVKCLRLWVNGKTGQRELIARHNVRRYLDRIRSRFEEVSDDDYVFRMRDGKKANDLHGSFEILLKEAGLLKDRHGEVRTLYSLRHTYATFQILNGIDLHLLARQMGTSIAMLEKHYSHLIPTMKAKVLAGKIGGKKI